MSLDKALTALGGALEGVAEQVATGIRVRQDEIAQLQRGAGLLFAMEPLLNELGKTLTPLDASTQPAPAAELPAPAVESVASGPWWCPDCGRRPNGHFSEPGATGRTCGTCHEQMVVHPYMPGERNQQVPGEPLELPAAPERPASLGLDHGGAGRATGHVPTAEEAIAEAGDRLTPQQRADLEKVEEVADQVDVDGRAERDAAAAEAEAGAPGPAQAPAPAPAAGKGVSEESVQKVLAALRQLPPGWQTTQQVAGEAGVGGGTAGRSLKQLVERGDAEHNGKGGAGGRYRLKDHPGPSDGEPAVEGEMATPWATQQPGPAAEATTTVPSPIRKSSLNAATKRVLAELPGTERQHLQRVDVLLALSEHGEQFILELALRAHINQSAAGDACRIMVEHNLVERRDIKPVAGGAAKVAWRLAGHPVNEKLEASPAGWGAAHDRQLSGGPPQNLRARLLRAAHDGRPDGLTTDQVVVAAAEMGATEPREIIVEEIRKLWRAGEIQRRGDGTYVTSMKGAKSVDADDASDEDLDA